MAVQGTTPGSAINSITAALASSGGGWQAAAGVAPSAGGGSVPSAPATDSGGDINSILNSVGAKAQAPTAPMYTASAQPGMAPNLHAPTMQPMQNTNQMPMTNQATSIKQARRQNRFAGIANAINSVTNEVQKQKFETLSTDVSNVTRAQSQIASAQQAAQSAMAVLKDPTSTPEAKKAAQDALGSAQKVITTNQQSMDAILKDDKKRKDMAKAFNVSFTDPSQNDKNKDHIDAGEKGLKDAKEAEAQGLHNNTPEEKAIADFNKATESGTYSNQFMQQQPQQLEVNPLYSQQLKQYEAQQKQITQYIIPKVLDSISKQTIAQMKEVGANNRLEFKAIFQEAENAKKITAQQGIAADRNATALKQTYARNAAMMARTYANIKSREKMASDPKYHVVGVQNIYKEQLKAIESSDAEVRQLQGQNVTIQKALETVDANVKAGVISEKEGKSQKENYQNMIDSNKRTIGYMDSLSTGLKTHLIGTPEGNVLGVSNGSIGQSSSGSGVTSSGPADDSDDEESVIDSGSADNGGFDLNSL